MKEYEITVFVPGGSDYFRTVWMADREKAEGIASELGELYGTEAIELVERTLTRTGYTYETLIKAEVWHE
ncbi:hypothetical protein [Paraburkholderia sp. J67]|uniref:hypothetical protein n=1 Tax=Paraburkholderia sp. J67 TaxID=2805435 RepID=UPI002ABDE7F3|nr:hypothetical protein [Paraburkholderia sp. J67]